MPQVLLRLVASCSLLSVLTTGALAQRGGPPPTPRAQASIDLTGYWVAIVDEDWRYRMTMPPKGDYAGVPLNGAGRQVAAAWDPAKDEAAGESCKAYGAAGLIRLPGRLRIAWQGDDALRLEADAGTQTRLLSFRAPGGTAGDWQGVSVATWDRPTVRWPAAGSFLAPSGEAARSRWSRPT